MSQVPGMGRTESFTRRRSSASTITPLTLPPRPAPLNRNDMTPEAVRDRITQLINQNAAIMEMPKADAPRPKRMSRQNSETMYPVSRSNSDVGLIGSSAALLPESPYLTPKAVGPSPLAVSLGSSPPDQKALSAHMHRAYSLPEAEIQKQTQKLQKQMQQREKEAQQAQQLVQVAKMASGITGVKTGTVQDVVTTVKASSAQGSPSVVTYSSGAPGTPLPQEIKIQIKLPKPGAQPVATASMSAVQTQQMIGQPNVLYPPTSGVPFGTPPPLPVGSPAPLSTLPSLGQPAVLHPLAIVSDKTQTLEDQQTISIAGPNDGSAIKELLLRDRRSSLQPSKSHDTPLVVIDPPQEDVQLALTNVSSGGIPLPHHDVRSLSVDANMGIPHLTALNTPTSTPELRFTAYDPMSPPKRGRPKGLRSKSEGLISPLVLPEAPTVETSGSKTSVQLSPGGVRMRMPITPSTVQAPITSVISPTRLSTPTHRPQLKLMIPQPAGGGTPQESTTQGATPLSATPTPSSNDSQYLSPSVNSPLFSPGGTLSQPQTPTTPSQFAKLKLKGKLLMKRSISIEKMEREKALAGGGVAHSPLVHSASIDANPLLRLSVGELQRSASIDETKLSRNKALSFDSSMDSPVVKASSTARNPLGRALSVQGRSSKLNRLQRSVSIHEEPMEVAEASKVQETERVSPPRAVESFFTQLPHLPQSSLIIDDKTLLTKLPAHSLSPVPVNKGLAFLKAGMANMAPCFQHSYSQPKESAPLLVNAPIKLVTTASDISRQESKSSDSTTSPTTGGSTVPVSIVNQKSSEGGTTGSNTPASGAAKPPARLMSDEMGAGNGRLSEKAQVSYLLVIS